MDATTVWEAGESLLTRELREEIVNSYPTLTEEEREILLYVHVHGEQPISNVIGAVTMKLAPAAPKNALNRILRALDRLAAADFIDLLEGAIWYAAPRMELPPVKQLRYDLPLQEPHVQKENALAGHPLNQHSKPQALDVLNILNRTKFKIDKTIYKLKRKKPEKTDPKVFAEQVQGLDTLIDDGLDSFYLKHVFDKRGRMYSVGYYLNYQADKHMRAMFDFAEGEVTYGKL